jgi:hypothetical protein
LTSSSHRSRRHAQTQIKRAAAHTAAHTAEPLEPRCLLSANAWKAAVSGDWSLPGNWSAGHVPTASDDVSISIAGNYTVTHSNGTDTVHSITLSHPLTLSGGSIKVATTVQANNTFTLSDGTLIGATVTVGAGGSFVPSGGTLDKVTLGSNITLANANQITVIHGLSLNGHTLTLASTGSYTGIIFSDPAAQTLSGPGTVAFAGSAPNTDFFNDNGAAANPLTLAANVTITASGGIIQGLSGVPAGLVIKSPISVSSAAGTLTISTFTNQGTITVNAGTLTLGGAWINTAGTIAVKNANATVNLGGTFSQVGTITRTAGTINLTGTDTVNGTLALTATTGSWNLLGGTLVNATLTFTGGATLVTTSSGGTFNHVTLGSDLSFPNFGEITVVKGLLLNGHKLTLASTGQYTGITFSDPAAQTLSGPGQVVLAGSAPNTNYFNNNGAAANPLTLAANVTITAAGGLFQGLSGVAAGFVIKSAITVSSAAANSLSISAFTNQGTMTVSAGVLNLSGPWASTGTIAVNNAAATANLGGTFSHVGTVNHTAGKVNITGTFTVNGTLALTAATGTWNLVGGTLVNATLTFAGGATLVTTSSSGTFNHVTLGSDLTFPNFGQITVVKGLLLNGHTLTLTSTGQYTGITFSDPAAQTLSGPGQVIFGGSSPTTDYFNNNGAAANPLTLGSGVTITAPGGGLIQNLSGVIAGLVNAATITATGGTLQLNGGLTNKGTLFAKTGNIDDGGASLPNSGTILVASGHSLTMTSPVATITNTGGGVLSGTGTIVAASVTNSATVSPGTPVTPGTPATGKLTITGNYTQTAGGTLRAELGGTSGGQFDVLAVSGSATLAGLLDVYLANNFHPAAGNVFGVVTYASHTGTFTTTDGLSVGNNVALTAAATGTRETLTAAKIPTDSTAPTASAPTLVGTPKSGGTVLQFKMTFSDNIAIDDSTFGAGDVRVTGPNGFSQLATFVSVSKTNNGTPRTVIYQITAPGGTLGASDNGMYTVAVQAGAVKDTHGNAVATGAGGKFTLSV